MNQKLILKIIRLSKDVLISYVRRAYFNAKMLILGTKLKKEKEDAKETVKEARQLAADFERSYAAYKLKRAERERSRRVRADIRPVLINREDTGKSDS